jgi:hypothetical protein
MNLLLRVSCFLFIFVAPYTVEHGMNIVHYGYVLRDETYLVGQVFNYLT